MFKKVFHFDSPRDGYVCDAAIVWCFDHRFQNGFAKFLKRNGVVFSDSITIAGGAKALASPGNDAEREFVLDQIRTSIRLHGTRRVILMVHSDCGGYGGLAAFNGDPRAEAEHHEAELGRAAECVLAAIPDVEVRGYFVDFEGIWACEPATATDSRP